MSAPQHHKAPVHARNGRNEDIAERRTTTPGLAKQALPGHKLAGRGAREADGVSGWLMPARWGVGR